MSYYTPLERYFNTELEKGLSYSVKILWKKVAKYEVIKIAEK